MSAFFDHDMERVGFVDSPGLNSIDIAGAGFQVAIVVGGILLGGYVDRTKKYKTAGILCFLGTALALVAPSFYESVPGGNMSVVVCLVVLGAIVGPVQPIGAELGVEVAYPQDENSIVAVQQIFGNLFSALLVPLAEQAAEVHLKGAGLEIDGDLVLLLAIAGSAGLYMTTFDSPLYRTLLDTETE
eukprot:gene7872-1082_t